MCNIVQERSDSQIVLILQCLLAFEALIDGMPIKLSFSYTESNVCFKSTNFNKAINCLR